MFEHPQILVPSVVLNQSLAGLEDSCAWQSTGCFPVWSCAACCCCPALQEDSHHILPAWERGKTQSAISTECVLSSHHHETENSCGTTENWGTSVAKKWLKNGKCRVRVRLSFSWSARALTLSSEAHRGDSSTPLPGACLPQQLLREGCLARGHQNLPRSWVSVGAGGTSDIQGLESLQGMNSFLCKLSSWLHCHSISLTFTFHRLCTACCSLPSLNMPHSPESGICPLSGWPAWSCPACLENCCPSASVQGAFIPQGCILCSLEARLGSPLQKDSPVPYFTVRQMLKSHLFLLFCGLYVGRGCVSVSVEAQNFAQ